MAEDNGNFAVYSIRALPAGIWGESYAVVTAYKKREACFVAEYFVLVTRPHESLYSDYLEIDAAGLPDELGTIDHDFVLQEGVNQTDLFLMDCLEERATELGRPDVAQMPFDLRSLLQGKLLGCWMRGRFNAQIRQMRDSTQCPALARYLDLMTRARIITRPS